MHTWQEGVVSKITSQLRAKLDRTDLEELQSQIRTIVKPSQDDIDAQLGKVHCTSRLEGFKRGIAVRREP